MAKFTVTFELMSFYEDENLNLSNSISKIFEMDCLDDLLEELNDGDLIENVDDSAVINFESDDDPYEVNIEYVLIQDETGKEVYRDEGYKH
jgi:hypothetical protein